MTTHSNALDLEPGVFSFDSPTRIAESLKRSADKSNRRKAAPFQSAMSMLNFFINRAGKALSIERKRILNAAKSELRRLYGKTNPIEGENMARKSYEGILRSGSGKKVTSRKQAVAIALNDARGSGAKVPKKPKKKS